MSPLCDEGRFNYRYVHDDRRVTEPAARGGRGGELGLIGRPVRAQMLQHVAVSRSGGVPDKLVASEVVQFLAGGEIDFRVLLQVVVQRGRTALGRADDHEIGKPYHVHELPDGLGSLGS